MIIINCEMCGEEVEAKRRTRRFCLKCRSRRAHLLQYEPAARMAVCETCGIDFQYPRTPAKRCPPCALERQIQQRKAWYLKNRERRLAVARERRYSRAATLKKKYGLTLEEYDQMVDERDGRCDICQRRPSGTHRSLCVDHCHETGRIRGLLCSPCNRAIGQLGDTAEHLSRALEYLGGTPIARVVWTDGEYLQNPRQSPTIAA